MLYVLIQGLALVRLVLGKPYWPFEGAGAAIAGSQVQAAAPARIEEQVKSSTSDFGD